MRRLLAFALLLLFSTPLLYAQNGAVELSRGETIQPSQSCMYAQRDTSSLYLDIFRPDAKISNGSTVMFVFGGGFIMGSRTDSYNKDFYALLVERGYTVVAIDYRLGLKGKEKVSPLNPKPAFRAVDMATEDLIAATKYLIDNHRELDIDTSRIFATGSSAGAITVLQADYEISNRSAVAQILPENFRYRGIVSFAGALFSRHGRPKYSRGAAPTLMYHGTADKLVVYKKIQLFNIGMFGTDALVKIFNKNNYPYYAVRYKNSGHDVASFPMYYDINRVDDFLKTASNRRYTNQVDVLIQDRFVEQNFKIEITRSQFFKAGEVDMEKLERESRSETDKILNSENKE